MSTAEKHDHGPRARQVELAVVTKADDHAAAAQSLSLPDGASAALVDDALELRDPHGALIFRYREGAAEVHAPSGDLSLCAPNGRITLKAGVDVSVEAARDVIQRGGRSVKSYAASQQPQLEIGARTTALDSDRLQLRARAVDAAIGRATLVAQKIATTATDLACDVERYELTASRLIERSRNTFREVGNLLQTRVRRMRTLVEDVHAVYSRRNVMVSTDDTSIDGKRILLG